MSLFIIKYKKLISESRRLNILNLNQIRNISKREWVKKYREPDYVRKKLFAACEPIYPKDMRPDSDKCPHLTQVEQRDVHVYDKLLGQDLVRDWAESRMICILHRNPMSDREKVEKRNLFQHQNMYLRYYENKVVRHALAETKYKCVLDLYNTRNSNALLFAKQPDVTKVLKMLKRIHQLILISAIIDGRILSYNQIQTYSKLPNRAVMLGHVCQTLGTMSKSLSQNITQPLTQLTLNLDQYVKNKQ